MQEEFSLQLHHKWLAPNTWQQLLYEIQTDRFMRCIKFFNVKNHVINISPNYVKIQDKKSKLPR